MSKSPQFSVDDSFALLASKIELPLNEYTAIANKQAEIEAFLAQYISTFTTVLPGAFSRKTLVSPLMGGNIDMYILFKYEHSTRFTPSNLLKNLLVTLNHRYEKSSLSTTYNAVIIPFENFQFRLQPGFLTNNKSYLVPAPTLLGWVEYNSLAYKEDLAKANSLHKGKLIPVIRMLKSWNHVTGNIFNDYYLELLAKEALTDYTVSNYQDALSHVFKAGLLETAYKKNDPANQQFEVEGLRDVVDLVNAMLHFKQGYKASKEAMALEAGGNSRQALECWRTVFPGCFPSNLDMVIAYIKQKRIKGAEALKLMQDAYKQP